MTTVLDPWAITDQDEAQALPSPAWAGSRDREPKHNTVSGIDELAVVKSPTTASASGCAAQSAMKQYAACTAASNWTSSRGASTPPRGPYTASRRDSA